MLNPLFRSLVKVAVASLVVGTIMAHFGITVDKLMREFGLSAERSEEYARQGFAWAWPNVLLGSIVIIPDLVRGLFIPAARQEQQRLSAAPAYIAG